MIRVPRRTAMQQGSQRERWSLTSLAPFCLASIALLSLNLSTNFFSTKPLAAQTRTAGDPERGEAAYQATCGGCHSIEKNRIGPRHQGVVGRQAGTQAGYSYSEPLKEADFAWDTANLDRWLTNPRAMVPGTRMAVRVPDPKKRADIIAYLAAQ